MKARCFAKTLHQPSASKHYLLGQPPENREIAPSRLILCDLDHEVQVDRLAIRPGALELSAGTALNSLFNAAHLLPVDHGYPGLDGMHTYQLASFSVHCQSSALFRALRFVVVLDP